MSILNWKQKRQERIDNAITTGKAPVYKLPREGKLVMDTSKVDHRAREFLDYTDGILKEHGITSKELRDQCCYDLFETMKKSFNQAALERGQHQDKFLYEMAGSLLKAGIPDEEIQEEIIIQFLAKFKRIGGF
jgi:hypothetical protein